MAINNVHDLIAAIDDHLADDTRQLALVRAQAASVREAFADLMTRLRGEVDAARGGSTGARHLRG